MPFRCAEYWEVRAYAWIERALRPSDDKLLQRTMLEVADQYAKLAQQRERLEKAVADDEF
jgi:hypothetical protein